MSSTKGVIPEKGDLAKVYYEEDKLDKERISLWGKQKYEVEAIKEERDQMFYYLSGFDKPVLRNEILLVKG